MRFPCRLLLCPRTIELEMELAYVKSLKTDINKVGRCDRIEVRIFSREGERDCFLEHLRKR